MKKILKCKVLIDRVEIVILFCRFYVKNVLGGIFLLWVVDGM